MAFFVMILTATLFPRLEREQKERITKNYYIELSSAEAINDFSDSVSDVAAEFRVVAARSAMREHIGVELTVSNSNLQSGTILQALRSQANVIFAVLVSEHT